VKELVTFSSPVERQPLNLDHPDPIDLKPVEWTVVTEENFIEVFKVMKEKGIDLVIIGVDDENYELLALNLAQVRRYILLQKDLINRYKEYYEGGEDVRN